MGRDIVVMVVSLWRPKEWSNGLGEHMAGAV
jgi:hypothetical protein